MDNSRISGHQLTNFEQLIERAYRPKEVNTSAKIGLITLTVLSIYVMYLAARSYKTGSSRLNTDLSAAALSFVATAY